MTQITETATALVQRIRHETNLRKVAAFMNDDQGYAYMMNRLAKRAAVDWSQPFTVAQDLRYVDPKTGKLPKYTTDSTSPQSKPTTASKLNPTSFDKEEKRKADNTVTKLPYLGSALYPLPERVTRGSSISQTFRRLGDLLHWRTARLMDKGMTKTIDAGSRAVASAGDWSHGVLTQGQQLLQKLLGRKGK